MSTRTTAFTWTEANHKNRITPQPFLLVNLVQSLGILLFNWPRCSFRITGNVFLIILNYGYLKHPYIYLLSHIYCLIIISQISHLVLPKSSMVNKPTRWMLMSSLIPVGSHRTDKFKPMSTSRHTVNRNVVFRLCLFCKYAVLTAVLTKAAS